jgi:phosphoribosylformylglycinamidine synthase
VLRPQGTRGPQGLVLANGINPEYGKRDAYRMALSVVDEAVRNAVAVGADPQRLALLDNFCWGDPQRPETLGSLVEAAHGCCEAAQYYGTPFISGKDSLNNEYRGPDGQRHAIPPTLLISAMGIIEDAGRAVTMDLKQAGNWLYLLGDPAAAPGPAGVPGLPAYAPALYRALHQAMRQGWVRACHDLSQGGLAAAAAEMCMGGRLGLRLRLDEAGPLALFGEGNACLLAEVTPQDAAAFEACLQSVPLRRLGQVTAEPALEIVDSGGAGLRLPVSALLQAWMGEVVR